MDAATRPDLLQPAADDAALAAREMAGAAADLIATLGPEQRALSCFGFADDERRNWDSGPRQRTRCQNVTGSPRVTQLNNWPLIGQARRGAP